jgi:hypothetical protein
MNQGYVLPGGAHVVTPEHNWICVARETGVGCLDIDDPAKCLELGMPPLPDGVFIVETPGKGLHIPFIHTAETRALGNVRNVFVNDEELIFEFKGNKAPWCAPWQTREKDGGTYKPRNKTAPLLIGLSPELIAWIAARSKAPAPKLVAPDLCTEFGIV